MNVGTWNAEVYHGLTQFIQCIARERYSFLPKFPISISHIILPSAKNIVKYTNKKQ